MVCSFSAKLKLGSFKYILQHIYAGTVFIIKNSAINNCACFPPGNYYCAVYCR